jgi:hypothetical protein
VWNAITASTRAEIARSLCRRIEPQILEEWL